MSRRVRSLAIAAAAVVFASGVALIWSKHDRPIPAVPAVHASAAEAASEQAIMKALQDSGVAIAGVAVRRAGEIVIVRGTATAENAAKAIAVVRSFGVTRVANLITEPTEHDDEALRRSAERSLTSNRALDGCTLRVTCENGVVNVTGTVQNEIQKDVARGLLRRLAGAREVRVDLTM